MNEMKAKLDNFFMEMIALKQENEQVKTNYNIGEQNNQIRETDQNEKYYNTRNLR